MNTCLFCSSSAAPLSLSSWTQGSLPAMQRPWQSPVPPLEASVSEEVPFPTDEEADGMVRIAWRGPQATVSVGRPFYERKLQCHTFSSENITCHAHNKPSHVICSWGGGLGTRLRDMLCDYITGSPDSVIRNEFSTLPRIATTLRQRPPCCSIWWRLQWLPCSVSWWRCPTHSAPMCTSRY